MELTLLNKETGEEIKIQNVVNVSVERGDILVLRSVDNEETDNMETEFYDERKYKVIECHWKRGFKKW